MQMTKILSLKNEKKEEAIYREAKEILIGNNLQVNEDKTESRTIMRRTAEKKQSWRDVIKLGSVLGNREDIKCKKELSNVALSNNEAVWKKKWKTKLQIRLRLYKTCQKHTIV